MSSERRDSSVLQTQDMLEPDGRGELFRLPVRPLFVKKRPLLRSNHGITDLNLRDYHQYCSNLAKAWDTTKPKDWLPARFLRDTPYTFTLLWLLPRLARLESREHAHDLLTQVWLDRQSGLMDLDEYHKPTFHTLPLDISHPEASEQHGMENPAGICVYDVLEACRIARERRHDARAEAVAKVNKGNAKEILDQLSSIDNATVTNMTKTERKVRRSQMRAAKKMLRWTKAPKEKGRKGPKGAVYVEQLEQRIKELESRLEQKSADEEVQKDESDDEESEEESEESEDESGGVRLDGFMR